MKRRIPSMLDKDIVVPFEITGAQRAQARQIARAGNSEAEKTRLLVAALFDPKIFAMQYDGDLTVSAEEALASHRGNCMALASAFIGLARAAGLDARYMDASTRVHETRDGVDGITINAGHITAVVLTDDGNIGLDFSRLGRFQWYRVISDLEALAHFHNNRGFEIVDGRGIAGWADAVASFERAARLEPAFAPAWNNLGIADERLGRPDRAIDEFRAAIRADPKLAAPRNNLGSALLASGDAQSALPQLEAAAELEPDAAHVLVNLAMARMRLHDTEGARKALERALQLRAGNERAQALLAALPAPAR